MSEPKLLAIDSATEYCSVAFSDGQQLVFRGQEAPRQHADLLLPFVQAVLTEAGTTLAELDAIVVGRGPGSFTGVRIAAGIAQGLAFSQSLPLIGVSSLRAMAQQALRVQQAARAIAAIDARMGEVYAGTYHADNGLMVAEHAEVVCAPDTVATALNLVKGHEWQGVGTGFDTYTEQLANAVNAHGGTVTAGTTAPDYVRFPHAIDMLTIGRDEFLRGHGVPASEFELHYVRNEVTWQKLPGR